jgi:hypothetical protein
MLVLVGNKAYPAASTVLAEYTLDQIHAECGVDDPKNGCRNIKRVSINMQTNIINSWPRTSDPDDDSGGGVVCNDLDGQIHPSCTRGRHTNRHDDAHHHLQAEYAQILNVTGDEWQYLESKDEEEPAIAQRRVLCSQSM